MAKKIYDIKPAKLSKKEKPQPKRVTSKPVARVVRKEPKKAPDREPLIVGHEAPSYSVAKKHVEPKLGNAKKWIFAGAGIVLAGVAIFLYFDLQRATVIISPKVQTLSFKQTVTADKSLTSVDASGIIPAKYFEFTKDNSQDFPATGNASDEGKASGKIKIYNKTDPVQPYTFKAGTHFMSDSGKLFVAPAKIVVPAGKKSGGKLTPGTVEVQVQAVEGGTEYNIAPSNFSLPGLKGSAAYFSVYGVSSVAMSGGYEGKVKKITDDDLQGAKDVLSKKTADDAIAGLKSQISSDYILLDNAVLSNVSDASASAKAGAVTEKFNYKVTVYASALAFKKSDIDQLAKKYLISQIPNGKTLLDSTFKDSYSASQVDVSGGKATIDVSSSAGVYQSIDSNSVALSACGKDSDQIKEIVSSSMGDQISDVQVKFWPFWVSKSPKSQKGIRVELKF